MPFNVDQAEHFNNTGNQTFKFYATCNMDLN